MAWQYVLSAIGIYFRMVINSPGDKAKSFQNTTNIYSRDLPAHDVYWVFHAFEICGSWSRVMMTASRPAGGVFQPCTCREAISSPNSAY